MKVIWCLRVVWGVETILYDGPVLTVTLLLSSCEMGLSGQYGVANGNQQSRAHLTV